MGTDIQSRQMSDVGGGRLTDYTHDYVGVGVNDRHSNNMRMMRLLFQLGRRNPKMSSVARDALWLKPGVITRGMQYGSTDSMGGPGRYQDDGNAYVRYLTALSAQARHPLGPGGTELTRGERFRNALEYVNAVG